ncbi:MAG TPA: hypothetical protein ENJ65_05795 [Candidatus Tenderia electrophaga]|uniref:Uncharacterized protein n=1 Tax=Candidatus Tenderia electrophaga TaxID=1748243 RepID=A0A832N5M6_9GAMM|nr:hypothetical protein [Candidatus Tenderia electrophaga]
MEFDPVIADDFTSFKPGVVATHVKLEQLLTNIGGGGTEGTLFKNQAMKAAGYKYDPIIGYAKHPDAAAEAFNKIRTVMTQTQDKDALLEKLAS